MEKVTFNIPSLSCSNCSGKIQEELKTLEGVDNIFADLKSQSVSIEYDPSVVQPQEIRNRIEALGYEVI
ncbi:MAG TPA: heavy-metal-associated domain-containing protein [Clostridiaceae bacterium]|nr:heavy-metal-associated domain-containing protein [Clostridiaceae bacterium]